MLVEAHPFLICASCRGEVAASVCQSLGHFSLWDGSYKKRCKWTEFVDFVFSDERCRSWGSYSFPGFWGGNMAQEGKACLRVFAFPTPHCDLNKRFGEALTDPVWCHFSGNSGVLVQSFPQWRGRLQNQARSLSSASRL